jgi:hypothetical protein
MSTYRCPVDDSIFQSDKGIPGPLGHIDCPGPACTKARGGTPPATQSAAPAPGPAPAPAPVPAPASDGFVLSDAEKAQILAARAAK